MKILITGMFFLGTLSAFACDQNQICKGDRVIDANNFTGVVHAVYSNGVVKFNRDYYGATVNRNIRDLSKKQKCHQTLCEGDRVIDRNNFTGRISEVFSNGAVKFNRDYYGANVNRTTRDLFKAHRCVESICVGDDVIDQHNLIGKVAEVFSNGAVKFNRDNNGTVTRKISDFGLMVECSSDRPCDCRD